MVVSWPIAAPGRQAPDGSGERSSLKPRSAHRLSGAIEQSWPRRAGCVLHHQSEAATGLARRGGRRGSISTHTRMRNVWLLSARSVNDCAGGDPAVVCGLSPNGLRCGSFASSGLVAFGSGTASRNHRAGDADRSLRLAGRDARIGPWSVAKVVENSLSRKGGSYYAFIMLLGYARASIDELTTRLQLDALEAAGCERIHSERVSGAMAERPVLADLISHMGKGDTLVVWRLDRLGRSLPHLVEIVQKLEAAGVALLCLTEGIDTMTPNGRLIFHLIEALAQFERELIRERAVAGLAAARARGRKGGRPPKLSAEKLRVAQRLLEGPESSVSEVARTLGVHRSTLHKALQGAAAATTNGVGRGLVPAG